MKFLKLFFSCLVLLPTTCIPIIIGSNTVSSREARALFPAADSNNTLLGFADFVNGFKLEDPATTCTYDNLFSVCGVVNFGGGVFTLKKDLIFDNPTAILRGGRIMGNGHSVEFKEPPSYYMLPGPAGRIGDLLYVTNGAVAASADTQHWSVNGTYLAFGGADTGDINPELKIFTFDGTSLTLTSNGGVDLGRSVREVRWHPTLYYLAVCTNANAGNEVLIYERKISNGTLNVTGGAEIGYNATSCEWHPSGNHLFVTVEDPTSQLRLYSFSAGSLTLTQSLYLSPAVTLNTDIIRRSPGGDYFAMGIITNAGPELRVFSFNGTTMTYTTNAEIGLTVATLDWSLSGTFIAVGLTGGSTNIRVYSHRKWNGTLVEEVSARINLSVTINGLQWGSDGNSLIVSTNSGATSQILLYTFDKTTKTFTFVDSYNLGVGGAGIRFRRDNQYVAEGTINTGNNILIFSFQGTAFAGVETEPFYFRDTALVLNSTTFIRAPWYFEGTCILDMRGYAALPMGNGAIIVRPGASLTIENAFLAYLSSNRFYCMTDNGSITLDGCNIILDRDLTFSRGALLFSGETVFTGTNAFVYSAARTSTIADHSCLHFDQGPTFSYAPRVANRNLLYMTDKTSNLYFANANLYVTTTGILLSGGNLFIDNKVTFSCSGRNLTEGILFDSSLTTNLLGACNLDIYGPSRFL